MGYRLSRLVLVMILAFISLPAVVSCKGAEEQAVSGEIKIEAGEFYFKPASITVKAGTPVKFVVANVGKIEHDFSFPSMGIAHAHAGAQHILPKQTDTLETTFAEPGTYEFVCTLPGHIEAGMKGTVKVAR